MLRICCASLPIKQIEDEDLADLKGKWEGIRNSTGKHSLNALLGLRTELEIKNDSLPMKASFFFYETRKGIIEYPILLSITEGKLASKKYSVILTLSKKGNRLRLKGQMEARNYYEELVFWKSPQTRSFQSFPLSQTPEKSHVSWELRPGGGRKARRLRP